MAAGEHARRGGWVGRRRLRGDKGARQKTKHSLRSLLSLQANAGVTLTYGGYAAANVVAAVWAAGLAETKG